MQSFLVVFYILEQGYNQCKEDDLGGFLGAISPELLEGGRPIDEAIFNDWQKFCDYQTLDQSNLIQRTYEFLENYEHEFGFNFCYIKNWLVTSADKEIIEKAIDKADMMCQKYKYDI